MKLLNIKKIAFASALVTGSMFSINASAQTNLITSFDTSATYTPQYFIPQPGTGTYAGGVLTPAANNPTPGTYTVSGLTNTVTLTMGHNFELLYTIVGSNVNLIKLGPNNAPSYAAPFGIGQHTISGIAGFGNSIQIGLWAQSNSSFTITGLSLIDLTAPPTPPAPSGPSLANTQASVQNTAQALQGTYTLQNAVLANSFAYDCNVFGENDVCVSGGARNTAVSAANGLNNTSALLIAAYRAMANVRVGAYADQNLSVNNAGNGINLGNNTPLLGLFAAWNENQDSTGTEVKVSAAYGQKNTTITRGVVGTGATASEAGSGSSQLNSQGAQITAKYGFAVADDTLVSPYIGIRYTQNNMGGYTEGASSSVTTPLSYSALNTNATTALAGVGVSYKGIPQTTLFASAGVETDTNTSNGSLNATGLTGLVPVNFNPNPVTTRPTATLGASYDVEKNQRLGITGIYRQEAYQATASTTVMATYTVGF